jgi:LL-diaminopimelate aminotransferase
VPTVEIRISDRLQKLPPYPFADLRRKRTEAIERGVDVINLGIGDPDIPTPDPVVQELKRAVDDAGDPNRHRYGCDVPTPEFPRAAREFYQRRFGVSLEEDQIVTTMGSKDAIAKFPMAFLNPGDVALAARPGYPTYNIGTTFASGVTYPMPLLAENDFLPDLDAIPEHIRRLARVMWINYPNNPTTATATLEFFEEVVEFGRRNEILIAHDSAYSENCYDGYQAPSILQVDGADDVAVEFFSLSKAFSMTGWRTAFVAGNRSAVAGLQTVKNNIDNGILRAIQFAAAKALDLSDEIVPKVNEVYQRRRDMVVDALNEHGWDVEKPKATMYIWAPVPEKFDGDSGAFATGLLEQTGVLITPGRAFGEWGEGFFRISLTYPDDVLREAMDRIMDVSL